MPKTAKQINAEDHADNQAGLLVHQKADTEERAKKLAQDALAALTKVLIDNSPDPVPEGARACPGCLANLVTNMFVEYCHSRDADREAASSVFENLSEDFAIEAESIKTGMPRELVRVLKSMGGDVKVVSINLDEEGGEPTTKVSEGNVGEALSALFSKKA